MAIQRIEKTVSTLFASVAPNAPLMDPELQFNLGGGQSRTVDAYLLCRVQPGWPGGRIALRCPDAAPAVAGYLAHSFINLGNSVQGIPLVELNRPSHGGLREAVFIDAGTPPGEVFAISLRALVVGGTGGGPVGIVVAQEIAAQAGIELLPNSKLIPNS